MASGTHLYPVVPAAGETGGSSYWSEWVSEPTFWEGSTFHVRVSLSLSVYMHLYIYRKRCIHSHWWSSILFSQRGEQDEAAGAVCVCASAVHVICVASCICLYICGAYMYSVCAYWESMLSLAVGWTHAVELQQPHLPWAAGSGLISPNVLPFTLGFKLGS